MRQSTCANLKYPHTVDNRRDWDVVFSTRTCWAAACLATLVSAVGGTIYFVRAEARGGSGVQGGRRPAERTLDADPVDRVARIMS
jgi:hypothetical protein